MFLSSFTSQVTALTGVRPSFWGLTHQGVGEACQDPLEQGPGAGAS